MSKSPFQPGDVISYRDMCAAENINTLQRGMNYRIAGNRSVFLMSRRPNAPYTDRIEDNGQTLVYEGHDHPRTSEVPDPKQIDQPLHTSTGSPTQNGLFYKAAEERGDAMDFERVRVYEKILSGTWVYNGLFALRNAYLENDGTRLVCKFTLELIDDVGRDASTIDLPHSRLIPSAIKQEVWKRDQGKCTECGATDNLHFDHVIPFSQGGSSLVADNVQILCARHNLTKGAKIQ